MLSLNVGSCKGKRFIQRIDNLCFYHFFSYHHIVFVSNICNFFRFLMNALKAKEFYRRDVQYIVKIGKALIINEVIRLYIFLVLTSYIWGCLL